MTLFLPFHLRPKTMQSFFPKIISYHSTKVACNSHTWFYYEYFCTRWQPTPFMVDIFSFFFLILFYLRPFSWRVLVWPFLYFPFLLNHGRTECFLCQLPRNTPWILSSNVLSLTYSGMHESSRHSLQKCCSLVQQFRSVTTKRSTNFTLTSLDIERLYSILASLVFSSSSSAFIEFRELLNIFW